MSVSKLPLSVGKLIGSYLDDPTVYPRVSKRPIWRALQEGAYQTVLSSALIQPHLRQVMPRFTDKVQAPLLYRAVCRNIQQEAIRLKAHPQKNFYAAAEDLATANLWGFFHLCKKSQEVGGRNLALITQTVLSFEVLDIKPNGIRLTQLPRAICEFGQLKALRITGHQIPVLPPEIGELQELRVLEISKCGLALLPKEIGRLQKLASLNLRHNQLKALPLELFAIMTLKRLFVNANLLETLPGEILFLPALHTLNIDDNPFKLGLPQLLLSATKPAIQNAIKSALEKLQKQNALCCIQ